ncbi:MAG: SMP-30/gluconolactonase/LRE family protein [Dehalococcoidia bacterium]|nr:SMP-30/gluconolactonase/LRE family protein [Dehalococcoidia bacterium]
MPDNLDDVLESPEHTLLATDLGNTEGPLWHPEGYLTFVDLVGNRLLRWDQTAGVSVVREGTGEGNGCTFDRQGRLLMCEGADHRCVTRMDSDGTVTTIAERWDGQRFHKPNDVVCRSDGSIYFTDPHLRLPEDEREYDFAGVFRIAPDGQISVATDGCEYPNGLAFSPDESVLYVAISRESQVCFEEAEKGLVCEHRKIRAFDVAADGTLSDNRVFASMASAEMGVPDGMKVDTLGRIFCTGSGGIWVFEPNGTHLGVIRGPEVPRNIAFGGPDFRTVYTTPGVSLYSFRVKTPGIRPY